MKSLKTRRSLIGAAAVSTIAGAALIGAYIAAAEPTADGPAEARPEREQQSDDTPRLSDEAKSSARMIAAASELVKQFAIGPELTITEEVPWLTARGDVIGIALIIRLPEPVEGEFQFLGLSYRETEGSAPYRRSELRAIVRDMETVELKVDLSRGIVASLTPGVDTTIVKGPDQFDVKIID